MRGKGSITVYACLLLAVLLSFLLAAWQSVQTATARVEISAAADLGMYSLFARYEPKLLEWYDLFLFDGGYGSGTLRQDKWYRCFREDAARNIQSEAAEKLYGGRLTNIQLANGGISGYSLVGDFDGAAVSAQILSYMTQNLGISGLQLLKEHWSSTEDNLKNQEMKKEQFGTEQAQSEYEEQLAAPKTAPAQPPADFVNPIAIIQKLQTQGILALVLPKEKPVSQSKVTGDSLYSKRNKQQGVNLPFVQTKSADRFVLTQYLNEKCNSYTKQPKASVGLQYQLEYILNGKTSDLENLKATAQKLLLLRETANLAFLLQNPVKCAEAEAMGLSIASALLIPQAAPAVTKVLQLCWAFGESILDIRELLDGGKIAPVKDAASWQLDLNALAELLSRGNEFRHSSKAGLSYEEYLSLLLFTQNQTKVLARFLDIAELRMRTEGKKPQFHMDCCVTAAEMELDCLVLGKYSYTVRRGFSYLEPEW